MGKGKFDKLITYISMEKQERISRFHNYEDAQRTLIGDIPVRCLLYKKLGIKNQELIFGANEYGKPFVISYTDIQYNIFTRING